MDDAIDAVERPVPVTPLMSYRTRQGRHHVLADKAFVTCNQNSHCALSSTHMS
jgi:hypothetical protein